MKKYKCIKDYHPLIRNKSTKFYIGKDETQKKEIDNHNKSIKLVPTPTPVVKKGDVMTQMGEGSDIFQSQMNKDCALYEDTLKEYKDCFKLIK